MLEVAKTTLLIITALFPIVDPLGGAPIFLALTSHYSPASRRTLSRQIAINSVLLLVSSFLIGAHILAFFGISLPVVQVGGGLVVMATGWAMLKQKDQDQIRGTLRETTEPEDVYKDAFYPLTLPLTVGPGSISVAVTLGANAPRHLGLNFLGIIAAVIGSLAIAASIYLCYGFADRLATLLGPTAMSVIMRLSSFLLVCIGIQIVWNGLSTLVRTLPGAGH